MKKILLSTVILVALSATAAMASGVNLNWGNKCLADGAAPSLTWACTSNSNANIRLTCTFAVAATKTNFVATDFYLEGVTNNGTVALPDWWKLGGGECRANAVTFSNDASVTSCVDVWTPMGGGGGGIGLYSDDTNRTHLNASWAIPDPTQVDADVETFAGQFRFSAVKTVGTGSCAGCTTPFTWALNYIQVGYQGEASAEILGTAIDGGQQCVSWNGGNAPCADPVPVRNTTWGQVKSLYR